MEKRRKRKKVSKKHISNKSSAPSDAEFRIDPNLIERKLKPSKEKVLEVILESFNDSGYWKPTKDLAEHLDLELKQLNLSQSAKRRTVYMWCSVIVLAYCMTHLIDYHEYWQNVGEMARAWLFNQPDFMMGKSDLIQTACGLIGASPDDMQRTIFGQADDEVETADTTELADDLGDWEELYLEEPPYTAYYRHRITYQTTWYDPRIPVIEETTATGDETIEVDDTGSSTKLDVTAFRIPKEQLRHSYNSPEIPCKGKFCAGKNNATVMCFGCDKALEDINASWNWRRQQSQQPTETKKGLHLCADCCDEIHMNPVYSNHVNEGHFRFISCFGKMGFNS